MHEIHDSESQLFIYPILSYLNVLSIPFFKKLCYNLNLMSD